MEYTIVFARDEDTYVCLYFDYYEGDYQLSEYISDVCIFAVTGIVLSNMNRKSLVDMIRITKK